MTLDSNDLGWKSNKSLIESTSTSGQPAQAVVNPDGSNIMSSVTLSASDIEIGAVELKNSSTDERASIEAANTARTTATKVLAVQHVDAAGNVLPSTTVTPGTSSTNLGKAIDSVVGATDTGVGMLVKRTDSLGPLTPANGDYTVLQVDNQGSLWTTLAGPANVQNLSQFNGQNISLNAGVVDSGTLRTTLATDVALPTGSNTIGTVNITAATGYSVDFSTALEASSVSKASAGRFYGFTGRIDSTAATSSYYFQLINASSVPGDGAVTFLIAPVKIEHTTGASTRIDIDLRGNDLYAGVSASTGIVWCISSTEFTKTVTGSIASGTLFYV